MQRLRLRPLPNLTAPARRLDRAPARCVASPSMAEAQYDFGPYTINESEVFAKTPFSIAFVNLKPVVPGHVLITPRRVAKRLQDLDQNELADMWALAQRLGPRLEAHFRCSSLTFAVQDGPQAGQTVPHVHIHLLPRKSGDFENNDEVYDAIDNKEKELASSLKKDLDADRRPRTREEMAAEAAELRVACKGCSDGWVGDS